MNKKLILILAISSISLLFACGKKYYNEWVIKDGKQYYYDEKGKKIKNCEYIIDGDTYCFNDKGQMLTGFQTVEGNKIYFGLTGRKQYGWKEINEKWYYFDYDSGIMVTGKLNDQGKQYYFYDSGEMGLEWFYIKDKNKYVYLGKDGTVKYGWHNINGKWYFFNRLNGYMFVGWNEVDGKWFYFDQTDGDLKTNKWIDNTYFVNENGEMLNNGWHNVSGQMLFFESDGSVNRNRNYESEIKQKQSNGSNNKTSSKGVFAKKSIMAGSINNILNIVYPIWKEFRASTNYADKLVKSKLLESYGNSLCDICESAYLIDKISNNIEGMEEDQFFWRLGLTYIGDNKWE